MDVIGETRNWAIVCACGYFMLRMARFGYGGLDRIFMRVTGATFLFAPLVLIGWLGFELGTGLLVAIGLFFLFLIYFGGMPGLKIMLPEFRDSWRVYLEASILLFVLVIFFK